MESKEPSFLSLIRSCLSLRTHQNGENLRTDHKVFLQNVDTLTVLVLGKGGVGKSSTVNSLLGERVAAVSAFQVQSALILQLSHNLQEPINDHVLECSPKS